ncbi:Pkinase protein [Rhizoctonia solani]|uniref:Magnesium transporter n=2 Tax=Rhizoctonia solani TaxID=456999 RepID=A0A8H7M920_9AGAM|nr:Pkinase protein [Rhizoctonia solani]KAF8761614.1 Pkinase protein [Rhizoctonia solani]
MMPDSPPGSQSEHLVVSRTALEGGSPEIDDRQSRGAPKLTSEGHQSALGLLHSYTLIPPSFDWYSAFGFPLVRGYSVASGPFTLQSKRFLSVEDKNDREYLNARCTTISPPNQTGQFGTNNGTFIQSLFGNLLIETTQKVSKVQLCRENGIQPRDLRSLDTDMHDLPASILVRYQSILFCTPNIRAIIKADKLVILESLEAETEHKDDSETSITVQNVVSDIQHIGSRVHDGHDNGGVTPFEFIVLESLLSQEIHHLSQTSSELTDRVNTLLSSMSSQDVISTAHMQEMIEVKDANEIFLRAATSVKDAISEVLSEPDDMRRMYLTGISAGRPREYGDDDEIELLLETYLKYSTSLTLTASRNLQRLNSASQHLTLLLSSTRNRLLHLEIRLEIAMLAMSAGALPAAIFGMNLTSHLEEHPWAFWAATVGIGMIAFIATQIGRYGLRKARRVKMEQAGLLAGSKHEISSLTHYP